MVVGLSPHKPAAAAEGAAAPGQGRRPTLMDSLTDLEPHVAINHKTYGQGA